jgi:hypothetical protein
MISNWILENLTDKDHIRGALRPIEKIFFTQMGKLKPAMGWDTVDSAGQCYRKVLTDACFNRKSTETYWC